MPPEDRDLLGALRDASPLAWAVVGSDGTVVQASRAFVEATGAPAGSPAPDAIRSAPAAAGEAVPIGARQFEVWLHPIANGWLVALADRTEVVRLEDQIWENRTRLSKAYAEVSVHNHALAAALENLRRREDDLSALNRELEGRVAAQIEQLERSRRLRQYLSPDVADSIVGGEGADLGTRKRVVTLLFADLSGFDDLAAEMESEEIIELLNDYLREMVGVLFSNGGTLDKFVAARITAFFGDPAPQQDHATRAVRTAIQMRERVRASRRRWFPSVEGADLVAGVHTGYVTVGNVGSEHRKDYTVIGKNVALASALQQEAKPGQVLVSARTHEAVKDAFDLASLHVTVKGSSRPITVYNALGERVSTIAPTAAMAITDPPTAPAVQDEVRMGPYRVLGKIGEGGMGVVYRALDERLGRQVALKVLARELVGDARFVERFKREARALASATSPHLAAIYFVSDTEIPPFYAMELVEGPSLARVLADQGRLPLRRALDLTSQIALGLQAAAEQGIIHRDVKPDNVLLTPKGKVKLTDFGLAKNTGSDTGLTSRGIVLGTPLYMSPEQARGEDLDLRSDIYSLGATLFHMLSGQPPFPGDNAMAVLRKHESEPLPDVESLTTSVSPRANEILRRMLAKRREDRFQDYHELLDALDTC